MSDISSFLDDPSISDESLDKTVAEASEPLLRDLYIPAEKLWKMDFPPTKWIARPLIPEGITFLTGDSNTYKSFISMRLLYCLSTGEPFLGEFDVTPMQSAYFDAENGAPITRKRFDMIGGAPMSDFFFDSNFILDEAHVRQLIELIKERGYMFIVIDPLIRFLPPGLDENSSVDAAKAMKLLYDAYRETGCSFLIVHHNRKANKRDGITATIRGSSDWTARADAHLALSVDPDDYYEITMKQEKLRQDQKIDPRILRVNIEKEGPMQETRSITFENEGEERYKEIKEDLEKDAVRVGIITERNGASRSEIIEALKGKGIHSTEKMLNNWLKDALERKIIVTSGNGPATKYYPPKEEEDNSIQTSMPYAE